MTNIYSCTIFSFYSLVHIHSSIFSIFLSINDGISSSIPFFFQFLLSIKSGLFSLVPLFSHHMSTIHNKIVLGSERYMQIQLYLQNEEVVTMHGWFPQYIKREQEGTLRLYLLRKYLNNDGPRNELISWFICIAFSFLFNYFFVQI